MVEVYTPPVTISELGTSDHSMVLWEPKCSKYVDTGIMIYVTVRCMGPKEKETFAMALSAIKWELLYILETCEEQYAYYSPAARGGNLAKYPQTRLLLILVEEVVSNQNLNDAQLASLSVLSY